MKKVRNQRNEKRSQLVLITTKGFLSTNSPFLLLFYFIRKRYLKKFRKFILWKTSQDHQFPLMSYVPDQSNLSFRIK